MKITERIANAGKKMTGWDSVYSGYKFIEGMTVTLWRATRKDYYKPSHESFAEAYARHGLDEKTFKKIYRNFVLNCWISGAFALFGMGLTAYNAGAGEHLTAIYGIAFTGLCLANAFRYSYRAFQLRHREFLSVSDWKNAPQEWIPTL